MGWHTIMEPSTVKKEAETAIVQMCIDVFGNDWESDGILKGKYDWTRFQRDSIYRENIKSY